MCSKVHHPQQRPPAPCCSSRTPAPPLAPLLTGWRGSACACTHDAATHGSLEVALSTSGKPWSLAHAAVWTRCTHQASTQAHTQASFDGRGTVHTCVCWLWETRLLQLAHSSAAQEQNTAALHRRTQSSAAQQHHTAVLHRKDAKQCCSSSGLAHLQVSIRPFGWRTCDRVRAKSSVSFLQVGHTGSGGSHRCHDTMSSIQKP